MTTPSIRPSSNPDPFSTPPPQRRSGSRVSFQGGFKPGIASNTPNPAEKFEKTISPEKDSLGSASPSPAPLPRTGSGPIRSILKRGSASDLGVNRDSPTPSSTSPTPQTTRPIPRYLECLRCILPRCIYNFLAWLFCCRRSQSSDARPQETASVVTRGVELPEPTQVQEISLHAKTETPIIHLASWIDQIKQAWETSTNLELIQKKSFGGCQSMFFCKLLFQNETPRYYKFVHKYSTQTYASFPNEMTKFFQENVARFGKEAAGYEAVFVLVSRTVKPKSLMSWTVKPKLIDTNVASSSFNAVYAQLVEHFNTYTSKDEASMPDNILNRFPIFKENSATEVTIKDLTL
ncbi:MAG: hypothetical protein ACHQT8_00535 [Chlamydiales bacterium]